MGLANAGEVLAWAGRGATPVSRPALPKGKAMEKPVNDPSSPTFRLDACLRKALGKELSPEEWEVVREVNRIQGWDKPRP